MDSSLSRHLSTYLKTCKYAGTSARIEVTAEQKSDRIEVKVRDSGEGFEPGTEGQVFEKFYRGKSSDGRGAVLGLAIVRAVVEAHGGTIRAYNHPLGGAVIQFTIPASPTLPELQPR